MQGLMTAGGVSRKRRPASHWILYILLLLDALRWIYWTYTSAETFDEGTRAMVAQDPTLMGLWCFGIISIVLPFALVIAQLKWPISFTRNFLVARTGQLVILFALYEHYKTTASKLANYLAVFGPAPEKLALILTSAAVVSFWYLLFLFVLTVPFVLRAGNLKGHRPQNEADSNHCEAIQPDYGVTEVWDRQNQATRRPAIVRAHFSWWVLASVFVVIAFGVLIEAGMRKRVDWSRIPAEDLSYFQASLNCRQISETSVDLLPGRSLRMYRYACDKNTLRQLPESVREKFSDSGTGITEALIFIDQGWFSKKVLKAQYTWGGFAEVVAASIDGKPSILVVDEPEGSSGGAEWSIITSTGEGEIDAAKRPELEHRVGKLAAGENFGPSEPEFRDGSLIVKSEIFEPEDPHCCPTGGIIESRYSLSRGLLTIASTRRLGGRASNDSQQTQSENVESADQTSTANPTGTASDPCRHYEPELTSLIGVINATQVSEPNDNQMAATGHESEIAFVLKMEYPICIKADDSEAASKLNVSEIQLVAPPNVLSSSSQDMWVTGTLAHEAVGRSRTGLLMKVVSVRPWAEVENMVFKSLNVTTGSAATTNGPPSKPPDRSNGSLTHVGLVTDPPQRINIGVKCPDVDEPEIAGEAYSRKMTPGPSCDYIYFFREIVGKQMRTDDRLLLKPCREYADHALC